VTGPGDERLVVLVSGSRDWEDDAALAAVLRELERLPKHAIIVHGAQRGIDTVADAIARLLGLEVRPYPADWGAFGRAAGMIRNVEMFDKERPNLFLGFHPHINESKGTGGAYKIALKRGIKAQLFAE
jgi:hypothetical protein